MISGKTILIAHLLEHLLRLPVVGLPIEREAQIVADVVVAGIDLGGVGQL